MTARRLRLVAVVAGVACLLAGAQAARPVEAAWTDREHARVAASAGVVTPLVRQSCSVISGASTARFRWSHAVGGPTRTGHVVRVTNPAGTVVATLRPDAAATTVDIVPTTLGLAALQTYTVRASATSSTWESAPIVGTFLIVLGTGGGSLVGSCAWSP